MNYDTAKTKFEKIVTRMQDDLKEYAAKKNASAAAIEFRLQQINDLVDFYTIATELISEEQMKNMELQLAKSRLWADTQKLVIFTQLHQINPNLIFKYKLEELMEMDAEGVRLQPPVNSLTRVMVLPAENGYKLEYKLETIKDHEKIAKYAEKYYTLNAAASRC